MATKVKYVVPKIANYHDGKYHREWRINREEQHGRLIASRPVADVFGSRARAVRFARLLEKWEK